MSWARKESSREVYLVKLGSMKVQAEALGIKKPFLQMSKAELQQVIASVRKMKSGKQYLDVLRSFLIYHENIETPNARSIRRSASANSRRTARLPRKVWLSGICQ